MIWCIEVKFSFLRSKKKKKNLKLEDCQNEYYGCYFKVLGQLDIMRYGYALAYLKLHSALLAIY